MGVKERYGVECKQSRGDTNPRPRILATGKLLVQIYAVELDDWYGELHRVPECIGSMWKQWGGLHEGGLGVL
jgi:hypothetical protein